MPETPGDFEFSPAFLTIQAWDHAWLRTNASAGRPYTPNEAETRAARCGSLSRKGTGASANDAGRGRNITPRKKVGAGPSVPRCGPADSGTGGGGCRHGLARPEARPGARRPGPAALGAGGRADRPSRTGTRCGTGSRCGRPGRGGLPPRPRRARPSRPTGTPGGRTGPRRRASADRGTGRGGTPWPRSGPLRRSTPRGRPGPRGAARRRFRTSRRRASVGHVAAKTAFLANSRAGTSRPGRTSRPGPGAGPHSRPRPASRATS